MRPTSPYPPTPSRRRPRPRRPVPRRPRRSARRLASRVPARAPGPFTSRSSPVRVCLRPSCSACWRGWSARSWRRCCSGSCCWSCWASRSRVAAADPAHARRVSAPVEEPARHVARDRSAGHGPGHVARDRSARARGPVAAVGPLQGPHARAFSVVIVDSQRELPVARRQRPVHAPGCVTGYDARRPVARPVARALPDVARPRRPRPGRGCVTGCDESRDPRRRGLPVGRRSRPPVGHPVGPGPHGCRDVGRREPHHGCRRAPHPRPRRAVAGRRDPRSHHVRGGHRGS